MAFNARVINVLIASPGDALPARRAIERELHLWNSHRGHDESLILRPRLWESDSVPLLGHGDAQSVINSQLARKADIIIAVFYNRLGSSTPRAASGTVEEIEVGLAAGKPVHLYFADRTMPSNIDIGQLQALREFRKAIQKKGLTANFKTVDALSAQVRAAIDYDVSNLLRRGLVSNRETESEGLLQAVSHQNHEITVDIGSVQAPHSMLDFGEVRFTVSNFMAGPVKLTDLTLKVVARRDSRSTVTKVPAAVVGETFLFADIVASNSVALLERHHVLGVSETDGFLLKISSNEGEEVDLLLNLHWQLLGGRPESSSSEVFTIDFAAHSSAALVASLKRRRNGE